jgi:hypothetical protein
MLFFVFFFKKMNFFIVFLGIMGYIYSIERSEIIMVSRLDFKSHQIGRKRRQGM